MVKAFTPKEAIAEQLSEMGSSKAVEIINEMLKRQAAQLHYPHGLIVVMRDDVIIELEKHNITRAEIDKHHLLDIIPLYQAQGWIVTLGGGEDRLSWSFAIKHF